MIAISLQFCFIMPFNIRLLFIQAYGRELADAQEWCKKYQRSGNVKDLTQAWDTYYHVFRRVAKQLPQVMCLKHLFSVVQDFFLKVQMYRIDELKYKFSI